MATEWKRGLKRATFRGVPFHTADRSLETGRAIALHEYPKRNSPYPEDMGKEARRWHVDAYVIGDDYMARRDKLIAACEKPGPGSYTDHWGRSSRVAVEKCVLRESSDEGRMAHLLLVLVEAGRGSSAGAPATTAQLASAADALGAVSATQLAARGLVAQKPASIVEALTAFGLPGNLAVGLDSALRSGGAAALSQALETFFGVALSRSVPARTPGTVRQEPLV